MKLLYTAVISPKAKQRMLAQVKYAKLHRRTDRIEQLAKDLNEKVQGWVNYFGKYAGLSDVLVFCVTSADNRSRLKKN